MRSYVVFLSAIVAALAIGFAATPSLTAAPEAPFKGPVGLQLYSLRNQFSKDIPGTLATVKRIGIRNVELAGTYGLTPEQFKAQLDAHGLRPVSAHFPFDRFRTDLASVLQEAKTLGVEYVGASWIPHNDKLPFDEKTCRMAIAVFNKAGEAVAKAGFKFFYHTHGYEFQPYEKGTLFDLMLADTNPAFVNFQMDVFWIVHSGGDPVKFLAKFPNRWPLMHIKGMKDGTPTGFLTGHSDVTNNVPLGTGKIDYLPILRAARDAGVKWYFIEDESPVSEKQIPQSLSYLSTVRL